MDTVNQPQDIRTLSMAQLEELAGEIRQLLIDTVARQGGHLAPNLGVVELTLAMHRAFDSPRDKLVFDVGHQAYVHKILTGRREAFGMLRSFGGICGFPNREESPHDAFGVGHASTAISAALGLARARDFQHENHHVVALVGDGALGGGMSYEALNDAGNKLDIMDSPLIVILNDNEMSISRNVGALSKHLTRLRASRRWRGTKRVVQGGLQRIPVVGKRVSHALETFKNNVKHFFVHGEFFETLGFRYLGPIDGHDMPILIRVLEQAKSISDTPVLIHVVTQKGRGYERAERKPESFHGTPPFLVENGHVRQKSAVPSFGAVAAKALARLAEQDKRVVAITAAMRLGTGLTPFEKAFPERCFDVGIAEEHAVTLAAGLAAGGMRPYFAVYSTFLQRGYDQIVHDICLQRLPVCLLIDRAGLVGDDGATHHGVFDIAFLRHIPQLQILAPRDLQELDAMMNYSLRAEVPLAIRYARDGVDMSATHLYGEFVPGRWEALGSLQADAVILTYGRMVRTALESAELLAVRDIRATVVNASTIKPLDAVMLAELAERGVPIVTLEEHSLLGGFGEAVAGHCIAHRLPTPVALLGICDDFVTHGSVDQLLSLCGLTAESVAERVASALEGRGARERAHG